MPESVIASKFSSSVELTPLSSLSYLGGKPVLAATLKQEFNDFCVDEELGFAFSGKGEHLCVRVRKVDIATVDVAKRLAKVSGISLKNIGYGGMKDRRSESTQWYSLLTGVGVDTDLSQLEDDSVQILETQRNSRKLKIGSHKSNHFKIRLRNCVGAQDEFDARLQSIGETGVPNYFAEQRFGRGLSNLSQALELFAESLHDDLSPDLAAAPPAKSKHKHKRFKRGMLFSATRSYLFNQLLSRRLSAGSWNQYVPGDVLNLEGTSRCFVPDKDVGWDAVLQKRLESFDIHLTGPLAGVSSPKDKYASQAESADIEDAVLKEFALMHKGLQHFGLQAARRPMRFVPKQFEWQWLANGDLSLSFSLSVGSYATSLLRELCDTASQSNY